MAHDRVAGRRVGGEHERVDGMARRIYDLQGVGRAIAELVLQAPAVEIDELSPECLSRQDAAPPPLVNRKPVAGAKQPIKTVRASSALHATKT